MMKKVFLSFIICLVFQVNAYAVKTGLYLDTSLHQIDAERNAFLHNNTGLMYMQEGFYYGAIKEFKLAIDLNPNTQATAVYWGNLGRVYLKIGYANLAEDCFSRSLEQNPMDFGTYQNLAIAYKRQGSLNSKIKKYRASKNPLSKVMVGVLLVEAGRRVEGLTVLDNFCYEEPDLIITTAVKHFIKSKSR